MNSATSIALAKELQSLLEEAGLPEERELIGRKFAFTYITAKDREPGSGEIVRVSGTILGIQICNKLHCLSLMTTPLPERRTLYTFKPGIYFHGIGRNGKWEISFIRQDIYEVEEFDGELELL
jgi:hypothetical protein